MSFFLSFKVKRGGNLDRGEKVESQIIAPAKDDELLAVDEALELLEKEDPALKIWQGRCRATSCPALNT